MVPRVDFVDMFEEVREFGCRIRGPCNPNLNAKIPASITSLGGDAYVLESVNAGTKLEHVLLVVVNIVIASGASIHWLKGIALNTFRRLIHCTKRPSTYGGFYGLCISHFL